MAVVYSVSGPKGKFEVDKPETGERYYVRKVLRNDKLSKSSYSSKDLWSAKREADRRAKGSGILV